MRLLGWSKRGAAAVRATSREKKEFREKLVLALIDKGFLAVVLAGATALATTLGTSRLEAIKAQELLRIEATKRQVAAINDAVTQQLTFLAEVEAIDTELVLAVGTFFGPRNETLAGQCEILNKKRINLVDPDGGRANRLWIPNPVRQVLDEHALALRQYQHTVRVRSTCVCKHNAGSAATIPDAQAGLRLMSVCFKGNEGRATLEAPWHRVQRAVEAYMAEATKVPGVWD